MCIKHCQQLLTSAVRVKCQNGWGTCFPRKNNLWWSTGASKCSTRRSLKSSIFVNLERLSICFDFLPSKLLTWIHILEQRRRSEQCAIFTWREIERGKCQQTSGFLRYFPLLTVRMKVVSGHFAVHLIKPPGHPWTLRTPQDTLIRVFLDEIC